MNKNGLIQPSKVHFFIELSNINPKQEESVVHVTPQSTDLLTVSGEYTIGELSLI